MLGVPISFCFLIKCEGTVLLLGSSAQKGTSHSTVGSEYKALGVGARELMYACNVLKEVVVRQGDTSLTA